MAETKQPVAPKSAPASESKSSKKGEFVQEGEDAQEKGYWGTRDNPVEDEEFALTTGPDAPITDAQGNPLDVDELQKAEDELKSKAEENK